jgi:Na+/phosphate symporter
MAKIRALANELPRISSTSVAGTLADQNASLIRELVPHEQHDDAQVYAGLARLLGGEDPMAALSSTHREIYRTVRLLAQMTENLPPEGADADDVREFERLLYGLDAIVRLHCAQEDELFHALGDDGVSPAGNSRSTQADLNGSGPNP